MPLVYDDIYEITRDSSELILWLQDRGIIGNFSRIVYVVLRGESRLKRTQATAEMDSFGDAPRKNAVIRSRLELEVGSRILI